MLQAGAATALVTRQADRGASAPEEVVTCGGTFDKQRARHRALMAPAALRQRQQRILVALGARAFDGDVGLARCRLWRGPLVRAVLEGDRARRAVLRVPEA